MDLRRLVEVPLALELFFADAVRFIPVQLSEPNPTVPQSYPRAAFHLPPVALPYNLRSRAATQKSIAVLPFTNLGADPENDYFSDGISEDIINALANVPGLRVTARTSSFALKGATRDIREIGGKLDVETVLEGSVRRAGKRLRITAQLLDVRGGFLLWSDRFDRELEDVFAVQEEIAALIANRLKMQTGAAEIVSRERPTNNLEAYDAYLRGQFAWARGTPESWREAVAHFERAVALDARFAQAYVSLASILCLSAFRRRQVDGCLPARPRAGADCTRD